MSALARIHVVETVEPALSPNRQSLADLLREHAARDAKCADLTSTVERLRGPGADEAKAFAALVELSEAEAAAMTGWGRRGDDAPHPQPDVAKRNELTEAHATAAAAAAAARSATMTVQAELAAVSRERLDAAPGIRASVYSVLIEELDPIVAELRTVDAQRLALLARAISLGDLLMERASQFQEMGDPERLVLLNHMALVRAVATPFCEEVTRLDHHALQDGTGAWVDLAQRLTSDATASLGSGL